MRNTYIIIIMLIPCLFSCTSQTPPDEVKGQPQVIAEPRSAIQDEKPSEKPVVSPKIVLSKDEINVAKTDISALIEKLNKIISLKDFDSWKKYLSDDYIKYYSNPEILKEKSQSPLLIKNKIVLRSLRDYFNYVVVGSRQNVKLDEIKVLDRDRIKAYMFVNNNPVIIYELIRIDKTWKIGKF